METVEIMWVHSYGTFWIKCRNSGDNVGTHFGCILDIVWKQLG